MKALPWEKYFSSGTQHRPVTAPCFFYVHERAVLIIPAKVTPHSPIPRVQYTFTQFTFELFNYEIVFVNINLNSTFPLSHIFKPLVYLSYHIQFCTLVVKSNTNYNMEASFGTTLSTIEADYNFMDLKRENVSISYTNQLCDTLLI
jgi:hypothetical protein